MPKWISLDTETTGLDPWHGSKPFAVTICNDVGEISLWEWDVDPFTREPEVNEEDLVEIRDEIQSADRIVLHNNKFDLRILETLDWDWGPWPWEKIHDTGYSAHLLASCDPKNLTDQVLIYLGVNLKPLEDRVRAATEKARRICRLKKFQEEYGEWAIAKKGRKDMPSAGSEPWKADMWLLRALIKHAPDALPDWELWTEGDDPEIHPWASILGEYANGDSESTLPLHQHHLEEIEEQDLGALYEARRLLLPIVYGMEGVGVTYHSDRLRTLYADYEKEAEKAKERCDRLVGRELQSLSSGSKDLQKAVFCDLGLVSHKHSKKTGAPSMDKEVMDRWMLELRPRSKQRLFIESLSASRKRTTAISYMDGYQRYSRRTRLSKKGWYRIHPSLNPNGTNTLRWSSAHPNEQNISKKEGFNLRYCFGPLPGRGWASIDYNNLELRIPAYGSGEEVKIDLFERADEPPFYGSDHLLNFSVVYEDLWAKAMEEAGYEGAAKYVKNVWKSSWYGQCKAGDFAVQYGSVDITNEEKDIWSTADKAFGRMGSHRKLTESFERLAEYNQYWIDMANETGYVHTMIDYEIDPNQGYPIQCSRTHRGISPTIPLNYHVQSTACWIIMRAMIKVQEYLDKLNRGLPKRDRWFIVLQVHDELVIDFPLQEGYEEPLREICRIMESIGDAVRVPLTVGCDIHLNDWSESFELNTAV